MLVGLVGQGGPGRMTWGQPSCCLRQWGLTGIRGFAPAMLALAALGLALGLRVVWRVRSPARYAAAPGRRAGETREMCCCRSAEVRRAHRLALCAGSYDMYPRDVRLD